MTQAAPCFYTPSPPISSAVISALTKFLQLCSFANNADSAAGATLLLPPASRPAGRSVIIAGEEAVGAKTSDINSVLTLHS